MFWKKILFLSAWYIAWSIVGSLYKSKKKIPAQLKSKKDIKQLTESFLEIQKNFINDVEKRFLSENGKEKLDSTKKKFHEYAEKYLKEGESLIREIQATETYDKAKKKWFSLFEALRLKKSEVVQDIKMKVQKNEINKGDKISHKESKK